MSSSTPTEALVEIKKELEKAAPHLEKAAELAEDLWADLAKREVQDGGAVAQGLVDECGRLIGVIDDMLEV